MKARSERTKIVFEPVDLIITIESVDELKDLWHRLVIGPGRLYDAVDPDHKAYVEFPAERPLGSPAAREIDKLARDIL